MRTRTKEARKGKGILGCLILFICILMLSSMISILSPSGNEIAKANGQSQFEIKFLVNGQSQIGLEDIQADTWLEIDMYMSALDAAEYGVATLTGTMYFDNNCFLAPNNDRVISGTTVIEDEWGDPYTYNLWMYSNVYTISGYDDRICIMFSSNTNQPELINVPIGQNVHIATIRFRVLEVPDQSVEFRWDFDDPLESRNNFTRNDEGTYHSYIQMDESNNYPVNWDNITLNSFWVGEPTGGDPSADLSALSLIDNNGGATEYIKETFDAGVSSYTTWQIPYADSVDGMKLDFSTLSYSADTSVSFSSGSLANIDANYIITGLANGDDIYIDVSDSEGVLQKRYTIVASVALPSNNADLSSLTVKSGTTDYPLDPVFDKGTTTYAINLPYEKTEITLSTIADDPLSTIKIDGMSVTSRTFTNLLVGSITKNIVVTAEDSSTKTYTVNIIREPASSETGLSSLSVNGNYIDLNEGVTDYYYSLPESITNYTFVAIGLEPTKQLLSYKIGSSSYISGGNSGSPRSIAKNESVIVTIRVIAQDNTEEYYNLTITRAPSTNTNLSSVTVEEGSITKTLTPQGELYTYTLGVSGASEIIVTATGIVSENSTVRILDSSENVVTEGIINIQGIVAGTYVYTIEVTPQDINAPIKNYVLNIIKKSDAKELYIPTVYHTDDSNSEITGFSYDEITYTYTLVIPYSVNEVVVDKIRILFGASAKSAISSPGWADLKQGAEQSGEPRSYVDINYNGATTAQQLNRDIIVTAEDGSVQNYILNLTRSAANIDNSLQTLLVGGNPVDGFASNTLIYDTPIIFPGDTQTINIHGEPYSEYASVKYNGEPYEQISITRGVLTTINVSVTAQSGAVRTYTIKVIAANTDNSIANITLKDGNSNPISGLSFDPGNVGPYNISVPYTTNVALIQATTPSEAMSTIYGQGTHSLGVETSTFIIYAVSEAGIKGLEYTIRITRNPARTEKILNSLTISSTGVPNYITNFNNAQTEYSIRVDNNITFLKVEATIPIDNGSSITSGLTNNFTWSGASATIYVEVTAEDSSKEIYTINVTRANDNNNIDGIQVDLQTINYNPAITTYALNPILYSKQKANFSVSLQDAYAKLYISVNGQAVYQQNNTSNFDIPLDVGNNTISMYAVSEYGTEGNPYVFTVTRNVASSNAELQNLEILAGGNNILVGENAFDSENFLYQIRVDNTIEQIIINATKADANAIVSISPSTRTLSLGANTFSVTVTAEDGTTQLTYEIIITRANDINDIDNIELDIEDIEFSSEIENYNLQNVAFSIKKINYNVTLRDTSAKLYAVINSVTKLINNPNDFDVNLSLGSNSIVIYAVSEFGTVGVEYEFNITQNSASNDATLSLLQAIAGGNDLLTEENAFDSSLTLYEIRVNNNINSVSINAVANDANASVAINPAEGSLSIGKNTFYITVTAEEGNSLTYKLEITRANDNNTIQDIRVNGTSLQLDYNAPMILQDVHHSVKSIIIAATLEDNSATIYGTGTKTLQDGLQYFEVYAISEYGLLNGMTKDDVPVYVIQITRTPLSSDNKLEGLSVTDSLGNELDFDNEVVFDPLRYSYTITLDNESTLNEVNIIIIAQNNNKTVSGDIGIQSLIVNTNGTINSQFVITVTAENGFPQNYTINIVKGVTLSNDTSIDSVTLKDSGGSEYLIFNANIAEQEDVHIPFNIEGLILSVTPNDSKATVSGTTGYITVSAGGSSYVQFKIIAENGMESEYTYNFNIYRAAPRIDNHLESLIIKDVNDSTTDFLDEIFNSMITTYSIRVDDVVESVVIDASIPQGNGSTIITSIEPSYNLQSGQTTTISIIVKAEDGDINVYTINILRANNDNRIESIRIGENIVPIEEFVQVANGYEYTILPNIIYSINTIEIEAILENGASSKATITGDGIKNVAVGNNSFVVYATAQDGTVSDNYIIRVVRESVSNDTSLQSLRITQEGDTLLEVLSSVENQYTLVVDRSYTEVTIEAIKNHPGARVNGDIGTVSLIGGTVNTFRIYVTAEDDTQKTYTINIDVKDDDNEILDIILSPITMEYDNSIYFYDIGSLPFVTDEITLDIMLSSSYAKLYINSNVISNINNINFDLNVGINTFVIYAESERGDKGEEYTIQIEREAADNNNYLSDLVFSGNGNALPFQEGQFNRVIQEYTIILDPNSTIMYVDISATAENGSTPQGLGLKQLVEVAGVISNTFVISVTAENGDIRNYSVTVIKSKTQEISNDNEIKDISLVGKGQEYLKDTFNPEIAIQESISVPFNVDSMYLSLTVHERASVIGAGLYNLDEGETITIQFKVIAENGVAGLQYQIDVTREVASSNNTLEEFYYEIDGIKTYLDPSVNNHTINVENTTESIMINGEANENVIVTGLGEVILDDTTTTKIITVEAENGDLNHYIVNIVKKSNDATIKSILLDSNNVIENFIDYTYEINVPYSKTSISILATPNNSAAQIYGNGNFVLDVGLNQFEIYAVSEAGSEGDKYTIKVNRQQANSNNNLASMTVKDTATGDLLILQPVFNSTTTKYTIDLTEYPMVQEILIEAVAENQLIQTIEGIGTHILQTLAGESSEIFKVSVIAENGIKKDYDITVIRNVKPEDDVTVQDLSFIGSDSINYLGTAESALNKFELNQKLYNITIPYSVKNATLTVINNNGAAVYGNGNYVLSSENENIIEFYLDSQSGNYSSETYVIIVTIEQPSDENTLSSLKIDGVLIEGFDPEVSSYEIIVSYEDVSSVRIEAEALDENAKVIGDLGDINLSAGNNNINITVKAEDESTRTYTVNVKRLSTDNSLLSLEITDYSITPNFTESIYEYTLSVPYTTEMVNVSATANPKAIITGIGHKSLVVGDNIVEIYATSEQGEKGEVYQVIINREFPSSDNTLKSLNVLSGDDENELGLQPLFNSQITNYIIQLDEGSNINTLNIFAEANCPRSKGVGGTGYKVLTTTVDGMYNNIFEIIVMAEDNSTKVYTVSVYRDVQLADDVTVGELSLIGSDGVKYLGNNGALSVFTPNIYTYSIVVPYYVESVTLSVQTLSASVYGDGQKMFTDENRVTFSMYLVSQSGSVVSKTYVINVNRTLPLDDNSLKFIRLNGQDIEDFSSDITQYEIVIPYLSTDKVIITAEPTSATSVILSGTGSFDVIEGRNVFSILVRAESGDTKSYNLVINYMNNNSLLESLSLQGSLDDYVDDNNSIPYLFTFISDTYNYIITVDKNIKTVMLKGEAQDQERAAIIGLGKYALNDDRTTIVVNVIAADNIMTSTYTIHVVKTVMPSSNTRLKDLNVDGYPLSFNPDNFSYMLSVGSKTENLDIDAITEDPNANATIIGNSYLDIGSNVILIKVEAEDGTISYYQLSVKRNMEPDYFLAIMLILIFLMLIIIFLYRVINGNKDKFDKKFKGFKINKNKSIDLNNIGKEMKKWQT